MTIALSPADLPAFRDAVIACAGRDEREICERLLGQLASLEAQQASPVVRFVPGPRSGSLARRALVHLQTAQRRR